MNFNPQKQSGGDAMNTSSRLCAETSRPFDATARFPADADPDPLREALKRCSAATYQAACQFRKTNDPAYLPTIILGIIERFVEPDLRKRLEMPDDNLRLIDDLGLDSLTLMETVILIEDVLMITIDNQELQSLRTLGEVRLFIARKLSEQPLPEQRQAG